MDLVPPFPDALVGAWHRRSVQLGDGAAVEPARVLWLQGAPLFADLRVPRGAGVGPFAGLEAFAGATTWHPAGQELSWAHHVDLAGTFAGVDRAHVAFEDADTMIETGTLLVAGEPTAYREVWARVAAGPCVAERWCDAAGTGVRVEIGPLSLTVAADPAGAVRAVLVADGGTVAVVGPEGVEVDRAAFDAITNAEVAR